MSSWFGLGGFGAGFGGSGAGSGGSGAGPAGGAASGRRRENTLGDAELARRLQDDDDRMCSLCKKNTVLSTRRFNESRVCITCLVEHPSDPERRGSLTDADVALVCADYFKDPARAVASARYAPYAGPGARAAGKQPAHRGAAGAYASAHKPHEPSIHDAANGRTVHVWVTNATTGSVIILNNTKNQTWDFPGGQSNLGETVWGAGSRELVEELRGSGTKPQQKEGLDATKAKKKQMKEMLDYLLENEAVHACVLHSGKRSVNIALVFKCKDDVKFINLLGLPNLEAETYVKAHKTYLSNEHTGWLLVHHEILKYADREAHGIHPLNVGDKRVKVFVHDTPVFVKLTNRKMMDLRLINALHNFLVGVNESRCG